MKKLLITFTALIIMLFCAMSAHAAEYTITGTVTADEGIEIGEDGLEVTLYFGSMRTGGAGSAYIAPAYPEYYSYNGISTDLPYGSINSFFSRFIRTNPSTVTIPYGERNVDFSVNVKSSRMQYVYYIMNDDVYMGYGRVRIREAESYEVDTVFEPVEIILSNYSKKAYISGTVTIPVSDTDTVCRIAAEQNRSIYYDEDENSYDISYDYSDVTEITIPAGEVSAQYTLEVDALSDSDKCEYTVYTAFENKNYKRQYKTIEVEPGEYTVDFDSFEKSKKISGTIALPQEVTEFKNFYGHDIYESYGSLSGTVTMQSAVAPYEYIDSCTFDFTQDISSLPFELYDDTGVSEVLISYSIDGGHTSPVQQLYGSGLYLDDTQCVPNLKNATLLKPDNQDIVMNIIKANVVHIRLTKEASHRFPTLDAVVQTSPDNPTARSESALAIRAEEIRTDESVSDYYMNIPEQYDNYILDFAPYNEDAYCSGKDIARVVQNAEVFSVSDGDTYIEIAWQGYEPLLPLTVYQHIPKTDGNITISISNDSDFIKNNATVYFLFYNEDEAITDVISYKLDSINAHEYDSDLSFSIPDDKYESAAKINLLCWQDMCPLSIVKTIK